MFGSDSIIHRAKSLYDEVNIFFLFLFSPDVFSYQWFACSIKLIIIIMEDKASSKDLDSQLSFCTQCMLDFYRKACVFQFVYRFFPSLSKL